MTEATQLVSKKTPQERNPTGKGGFGDNPQNASPGGWKKENTISYQYNRFMNMTPEQLKTFVKAPDSEKTMAMVIAFGRIEAAPKSLPDAKEIADRTEGRAAQSIELNSVGEIIHKFEDLDDEGLDRIIKARQDRLS